ncbi:ABC transporter ATP-binding protein [Desulfobacter curvatus]|uniref:ABC transporter ATP-binding protein n=1 Tax=Desulfobacter curvatus TaxID=2290 RepID=UPI00036A2E28|nr:ABC transporter ATP-binding protein [Desulfobacter curvatus]
MPCPAGQNILSVRRLKVSVSTQSVDRELLRDVNFTLNRGEIHGLVGESGCGKSLFARTLVRLEAPARIVSSTIFLDNTQVSALPAGAFAQFRGKKISLVLQNPASAMDPVFTMASQFKDALSILPKGDQSMNRVYQLLKEVGIPSPEQRCRQYPHEWSRGMLQRAQLVMALLGNPGIMILDEVTSGLDPTIALQILELISRLRQTRNTAFIMITHDLAMAAHICDTISVMRHGSILETNDVKTLFNHPEHAYTREFISGMGQEALCPNL